MSDMNKAIVSAQSELKNPAMDAVNPHFRSRFASLKAVREAVLPVFNKHGLAIIQRSVQAESGVGVNTIILHEDGETLDCGTMEIPVKDNNPQAYCSAMTYVRRYTLQAVAGVVGDPDDDGNKASEEPAAPKQEAKKPAKKADAPSGGDIKWYQMMTECKKALGEEEYRRILGVHGYTSSKEIKDRAQRKACYSQMTDQIKANAELNMGAEDEI
jgi:hypothetical protein